MLSKHCLKRKRVTLSKKVEGGGQFVQNLVFNIKINEKCLRGSERVEGVGDIPY